MAVEIAFQVVDLVSLWSIAISVYRLAVFIVAMLQWASHPMHAAAQRNIASSVAPSSAFSASPRPPSRLEKRRKTDVMAPRCANIAQLLVDKGDAGARRLQAGSAAGPLKDASAASLLRISQLPPCHLSLSVPHYRAAVDAGADVNAWIEQNMGTRVARTSFAGGSGWSSAYRRVQRGLDAPSSCCAARRCPAAQQA